MVCEVVCPRPDRETGMLTSTLVHSARRTARLWILGACVVSALDRSALAELDQFYETPVFGNTIIAARFECAQTFRVGRSGLLTHVEVNIGRFRFSIADNVPLTLDIRRTINGVPVEENSGPNVLTSLTKLAFEIPFTNGIDTTFREFDFPDVQVSVGEQLAIVMRTPAGAVFGAPDDGPFAWADDDNAGYVPGRAFARGVSASGPTWGNGGTGFSMVNNDYEFRTYVTPEPASLLAMGLGLLAGRRRRVASV